MYWDAAGEKTGKYNTTMEAVMEHKAHIADGNVTDSITAYWGEDKEYHSQKGEGFKNSYYKNGEKFMKKQKEWNKDEGFYRGSMTWDKDDGEGE